MGSRGERGTVRHDIALVLSRAGEIARVAWTSSLPQCVVIWAQAARQGSSCKLVLVVRPVAY